MKHDTYYHLDALKLHYTAGEEAYQQLKLENGFKTPNFTLHKSKDSVATQTAKIQVRGTSNKYGDVVFGEITYIEDKLTYLSGQYQVSLKLDNSFLYHHHHNLSIPDALKLLAKELGLTFENITYFEVAADVTCDASTLLLQAIRGQEYRLLVGGKEITDRDAEIPGLRTLHPMSRNGEVGTTLYCSPNKEFGKYGLKVYDKKQEIAANHKEYIYKEYGCTPTTLYRIEAACQRDQARSFAKHFQMSESDFLFECLLQKITLPLIHEYATKRLLRFKTNRRHIYSPLDILQLIDYNNGGSKCLSNISTSMPSLPTDKVLVQMSKETYDALMALLNSNQSNVKIMSINTQSVQSNAGSKRFLPKKHIQHKITRHLTAV